MKSLLLALIGLSFLSCKLNQTDSLAKHEFGETSVKPTRALLDCHVKENKQVDPLARLGHYPKTEAYLKNIGNYVMSQNPQAFKGPYAPAKFCFSALYADHFNAYAIANTREVMFHTQSLLNFNNDAEAASVMAHELAHITMQHEQLLTHADMKKMQNQYPNSQNNIDNATTKFQAKSEIFFQKSSDLHELMETIRAKSAEDRKNVDSIRDIEGILQNNKHIEFINPEQWEKYQAIIEKHYTGLMGGADGENGRLVVHRVGEVAKLEKELFEDHIKLNQLNGQHQENLNKAVGPQQIANGKEREADEVGLEFYLRAGLNPNSMFSFWGAMVDLESGGEGKARVPQALLTCLKNMYNARRLSPERGFFSHPTGCWRLANIAIVETQKHKKDYAPFLKNANRINIPGPFTLAEVKKEIQELKPPKLPENGGQNPQGQNPQGQNPNPSGQYEVPDHMKQADQRRKVLCQRLGGRWIVEPAYPRAEGEPERYRLGRCQLPDERPVDVKKADCAKFGGYWHDKCDCLPIKFKDKELDLNTCLPKFDPSDMNNNNHNSQGTSL